MAGLLLAPLGDVALAEGPVVSDPAAVEVPVDVLIPPPDDGGIDNGTCGFAWGG